MILKRRTIEAILALLIICIASVVSNEMWKHVKVSTTLLNSQSNTSNKYYNFASDILCSMTSSRIQWANLFCIRDGICWISSFKIAPYESLILISDPVDCMTKLNGCFYNDTYYAVNDVFEDSSVSYCKLLVCRESGIMTPPQVRFSGICPAPFIQTSCGCFHLGPATTWCNARKYCLSVGGDLWTYSYLSTLSDFSLAVGASGCFGCYIGLYGYGSELIWLNGSLGTNTYMLEKLSTAPSPPVDGLCVRHGSSYGNYMVASSCQDSRQAMCEVVVRN